jgi:hypothetical protein
MTVQRLVWVVFAPLTIVSWLFAHSLAYRLATPHEGEGTQLLADTGHGYLDSLVPVLLAGAVALVVAGFAAAVVSGLRGLEHPRASLAVLGAVAPIGFAVQEHLERLVETGSLPLTAALDPTFAVGLLIVLSTVVPALLLARTLLAVGRRLGQRLRTGRAPLLSAPPPRQPLRPNRRTVAWRAAPAVCRHAPRSPPANALTG